MRKKILLITYMFPPVALPEAFLCPKRLAHFTDHDVDVITCPPYKKWMGNDTSLGNFVETYFNSVTHINVPFWHRFLPFWRLGLLSKCPDAARLLNKHMLDAARHKLKQGSYDLIFTWSQWHSVHLIGSKIKDEFPNMKWVSYFSDPWVNNPYRNDGFIAQAINKRLEQEALEKSDLIFYSTEQTKKHVANIYGDAYADKTYVLPHGFEGDFYETTQPVAEEKFVVRYIGGLYGERNPIKLIEALKRIKKNKPGVLEGVKFEFIGPLEQGLESKITIPDEIQDCVSFHGSVPYLESLNLMKSADALLILDAPGHENLFLPSKLIDYIGAGKPIMGLTPPGTSAYIIKELGGQTALPDDLDMMYAYLMDTIAKYKEFKQSSPTTPWGEKAIRKLYDSRELASKMEKIIIENLSS